MSIPKKKSTYVNPEVWFTIFHEPRYLTCLVELLKNCFDWGTSTVRAVTSRTQFSVTDDGCGMNEANRHAFLAVGMTTATGSQSGFFGTGSKKIIFTFASNVRVVTAPENEPDAVYVLEFTPMELAEAFGGMREFTWTRADKNTMTWTHEHPFGSEITYTLKEPSSRSIMRGASLASKLSDRLGNEMVQLGMVLVDGEKLPPKQFKGELFDYQETVPGLGRVRLEFYRPASNISSQDLLLTDRAIGEVSLRDELVKHLLDDDVKELVPPLFLENEVCGLISAEFLHDHVAEKRTTYSESITNDERIRELLRLLSRLETAVAKRLGITLRYTQTDEVAGKQDVEGLIELCQQRYNPDGTAPEGAGSFGTSGSGDNVSDDTEKGKRGTGPRTPATKGASLSVEREEFALGELITATLKVPQGGFNGWHFYIDQSQGKVVTESPGKIVLEASATGRGLVQAMNPLTGDSAKTEYRVVLERELKPSLTYATVEVGSPITLKALNSDKAKGQISWRLLAGEGELVPISNGHSARFTPSAAGRMEILFSDTGNELCEHAIEIRVTPKTEGAQPLKIRDQYFRVEYAPLDTARFDKPATIVMGGEGEVHYLYFNNRAPGWNAALSAGNLLQYLVLSTAVEFAKHFCVPWDELSSADMRAAVTQTQSEAAKIFEEMLSGNA